MRATASLPTRTAVPSRRARQAATTITLVLLVVVIAFGLSLALGRSGERISTQLLVQLCAVLALAVFSGNSGIMSFGHAAFLGIGAYASGVLTMPAALQKSVLPSLPTWLAALELPYALSLAIVSIIGGVVGLLVGVPIARLKDASATIATLALLIIVHSVLIGARDITRGAQTFYGVPRETGFEAALLAAVVFIVVACLFRESRAGLRLRAVRDNEPAAVALGIDARRARLFGFALSALLGAVAGALYGHMLGAFSPRDFYFALTFSMVAMLVVGGLTTVSGAVLGVVGLTLLGDFVRQVEGGFNLGTLEVPAVFGLTTAVLGVAMLLVIWLRPDGLFGRRELQLPGLARAIGHLGRAFRTAPAAAAPAPATRALRSLSVTGLSRRFDGLVAVDGASFEVPPATVTGLIGPNGAGKSTLVNLLSGQLAPSAGTMRFGETDLGRLPAHRIARLGLTRTFQNNRLFERLSVFENVLVAAECRPESRANAPAVALRDIEALGLAALRDDIASSLPYGARKRLEIARCLALEPALILLDEPAAGMNDAETNELAERLGQLCTARGIALLLIDHDLEFVNRLSSNVVVMNRGRIIATGTPPEIRANPAVIEAYIGRGRSAADAPPSTTTTTQPAHP